MRKLFYRFRSIDSLLGEYKELESQTIFFAEPKDLNDPMEGLRDIFWTGDKVVWTNLFKNYILCLERMCSLVQLWGESKDITGDDLPVFSGEDDFPSDKYKDLFLLIAERFLGDELIASLIKSLSKRTFPIRSDELSMYFERVHLMAIYSISTIYAENGLGQLFNIDIKDFKKVAEESFKEIISGNLVQQIESIANNEEDGARKIEALLRAIKSTQNDFQLSRHSQGLHSSSNKNLSFLIYAFPERYMNQIERLLFPNWYTACFMTECRNSSIWGHYGKNHTGACLIFESENRDGEHYLALNEKNGYSSSGYSYSYQLNKFYEIDYIEGVGEVDFFRMLGRLPIPKLNSSWYLLNGEKSFCADEMDNSLSEWRKKYWSGFYRDITKKTDDWKYENEFRLILSEMMIDFSDPKDRALKYKFSSLKGMIFGIKTSVEDKISIINIIKSKISESEASEFTFYQAYYDANEKKIEHFELTYLNRIIRNSKVEKQQNIARL